MWMSPPSVLQPCITLLTQTTLSARDSYVPLHSSEPLFQFPSLSAMNMMLARPTGQSINILPKTGPTGGNSTLSATGFIPLVLVISSILPWGWCANDTTNIIKRLLKLCMETEDNGITLLNDVNGSCHLIGALTCRQMTTPQVLEAMALLKEMHLPFLPKYSKPALWITIMSWHFETDWECHSRAMILHSQRNYKQLSIGP